MGGKTNPMSTATSAPMPSGTRAAVSPAGSDKCISRTPSAVSEAETTIGSASRYIPRFERAVHDEGKAGENATISERIAATWTLFAWLGYIPSFERAVHHEGKAGENATVWERMAATWTLFAWLGYLPGFSEASAPVSLTERLTCQRNMRDLLSSFEKQQGQPSEEGTLMERLTATWILLAWLGYLPAFDTGNQDDATTSEHITLWERAAATWSLIAWLGYGPASIACGAFVMLACAALVV